ncbi:MAG: trigger factor [Candidatus Paceibacterota bacterium]
MDINKEQLSDSKVKVTVSIPSSDFKPFIEKAKSEVSDEMEIEGFRKGNVPADMAEERVGEENLLQQAAQMAIEDKYEEIVTSEDIQAVGQPQIKILKLSEGDDLKFEAEIPVLPPIELPDYKEIASNVEAKEISVSDEEYEQALNRLKKSRAKMKQVDRAAQEGDFVKIEFESDTLDLEKEDGFILGEGHMIPGFEENIEGMEAGQEKEFTVEWPEDHHQEELQGKEVDFEVLVKQVQEVEMPEITDEWAQGLGEQFETAEDLKQNLKEGLEKEKNQQEQQRVREKVLQKISQEAEIDIPEELVQRQRANRFTDLKQRLSQQDTSLEEYLEQTGQSKEEIQKSLEKQAKQEIKRSLLLREIAQKEGIEVSDQEVEQRANQMLQHYGEEQMEQVDTEQIKGYVKEQLRNQKTLEFLEKQ